MLLVLAVAFAGCIQVLATLTDANVDHHTLRVDIDGLEIGQFGATDAGAVECDQDRPVKWRKR